MPRRACRKQKPGVIAHIMRTTRRLGTILGCVLLLQGCDEPPKPSGNFHHAVQSANLVQIKRHLYWGTDPGTPGPGGELPLNIAARNGDVAIAKELLKHGADPNRPGPSGRTPLTVALAHGRVPLARLLLSRGAEDDPQALLHELVQAGLLDRDTLDLLLKQGATLDTVDPDGHTPLALAVGTGSIDITKLLLEQGAPLIPSMTPEGAAEAAPAPTAADIDDPPMVQLLRRYGVIE
jgi:ankyrin repeat protein